MCFCVISAKLQKLGVKKESCGDEFPVFYKVSNDSLPFFRYILLLLVVLSVVSNRDWKEREEDCWPHIVLNVITKVSFLRLNTLYLYKKLLENKKMSFL